MPIAARSRLIVGDDEAHQAGLIGRVNYPLEEALLLCLLQRLAKRKPSSISRGLVRRRGSKTSASPMLRRSNGILWRRPGR
jgi:hypothetical protein